MVEIDDLEADTVDLETSSGIGYLGKEYAGYLLKGGVDVNCILRKWRLSDAKDLAAALNDEKILNNLRDSLPFPYTEQDASDYSVHFSSRRSL